MSQNTQRMGVYTQSGMNIRSVGGSSVRGVGYFFLVVGVIGAVITIFMILFGFTSTILWEAFFGLVALAIFGYILIGVYILPEWIRVPMLLLGKYRSMRGPGIFWVAPWIYVIPFALDIRVITTSFSAEQTLTKDNVPVNVDAVLFWQVIDPFKASIKVQDYRNAIMWASQTSLRDIIGKTDLSAMLVGREQIARELGVIIDARTQEWGVKSIAVEVRDVVIPTALQDAMSRQAQAERERQARIILASSEEQIAQKFLNAAEVYENDAVALNLRAMNILYESMKEKGTWVIVPSQMANLLGNLTQIPVPNIQKKTGPTRAEEYPRNEEEQ